MAEERPVQGGGDGGDGNRPDRTGWLDDGQIEERLTDAVSDYRVKWPNCVLKDQGSNWAIFERGWLYWKSTEMVMVYGDGFVETIDWRK